MTNNDILRSIRYMLDLGDLKVVSIVQMAGVEQGENSAPQIDKSDVQAFARREEEEGYLPCSDEVFAYFLEGLVVYCRGRDPNVPQRPVEPRISNNVVLKKLRVAFELKDVDMHEIFASVGFPVSRPELSALFRQAGHKNYRVCGDQMLRNFLKGLTQRVRPG